MGILLSVLLFFIFGSYSYKQSAKGFLVSNKGLVEISAPKTGVVTQVYVAQGQKVLEGEPLVILDTSRHSDTQEQTEATLLKILQEEQAELQIKEETIVRDFELAG